MAKTFTVSTIYFAMFLSVLSSFVFDNAPIGCCVCTRNGNYNPFRTNKCCGYRPVLALYTGVVASSIFAIMTWNHARCSVLTTELMLCHFLYAQMNLPQTFLSFACVLVCILHCCCFLHFIRKKQCNQLLVFAKRKGKKLCNVWQSECRELGTCSGSWACSAYKQALFFKLKLWYWNISFKGFSHVDFCDEISRFE